MGFAPLSPLALAAQRGWCHASLICDKPSCAQKSRTLQRVHQVLKPKLRQMMAPSYEKSMASMAILKFEHLGRFLMGFWFAHNNACIPQVLQSLYRPSKEMQKRNMWNQSFRWNSGFEDLSDNLSFLGLLCEKMLDNFRQRIWFNNQQIGISMGYTSEKK